MILYQEVKLADKLEGEDHKKKDIVIATYAYAVDATTSTATVEYMIKEITVVRQDEALVGLQQGFAVGDGE